MVVLEKIDQLNNETTSVAVLEYFQLVDGEFSNRVIFWVSLNNFDFKLSASKLVLSEESLVNLIVRKLLKNFILLGSTGKVLIF